MKMMRQEDDETRLARKVKESEKLWRAQGRSQGQMIRRLIIAREG